jgi:hypothetical protein
MPGCGAAVRGYVVKMVRSARVFSGGGMVAMGTFGVTTLHPRGHGNPKLPPLPEAASPSSEDSSRTVCKEGDSLCTIPTNMAYKPSLLGERLRLLKRSVLNSKLPKQIISSGANSTSVGLLPLATKVSFSE